MTSYDQFVRLAIALLCLGCAALPAAGQNQAFESAEKTPVAVHSVSTGGFWMSGNAEGFFRTVVIAGGVEHVSHRLFIQWLKNDPATQSYQLVRTSNVRELNLDAAYVLKVTTAFGDINRFKITVTANARGREAKRFAITAKGEGGYTIRSR